MEQTTTNNGDRQALVYGAENTEQWSGKHWCMEQTTTNNGQASIGEWSRQQRTMVRQALVYRADNQYCRQQRTMVRQALVYGADNNEQWSGKHCCMEQTTTNNGQASIGVWSRQQRTMVRQALVYGADNNKQWSGKHWCMEQTTTNDGQASIGVWSRQQRTKSQERRLSVNEMRMLSWTCGCMESRRKLKPETNMRDDQ